jgi:hypothetical protein
MRSLVDGAPARFGAESDAYRGGVIFLMPRLTASNAMPDVAVKEGVDHAHAGRGVLYSSRLIERASQAKLSRLVSMAR